MHKFSKTTKLYLPIVLFIVGWWVIAFKATPSLVEPVASLPTKKNPISTPADNKLSKLEKTTLKQALAGDVALMTQLIVEWDIDAQFLQSVPVTGTQRLSQAAFLRSQEIGRFLASSKKTTPSGSYLPQTYAAASYLFALVSPDEIVAIPEFIRNETELYPKELTDQVPLNIDRYNSEKLFLRKPQIAFVAHYSDPMVVQALSNQGILLHTMRSPLTIDDLTSELIAIGEIVNHPMEAELLRIFIDAAFIALDNRLLLMASNFLRYSESLPRILVINHHQSFHIPTLKTLTGQLLSRIPDWDISLDYVKKKAKEQEWTVPIDKENLLNLDPDHLIIIGRKGNDLEKKIINDPCLREIKAVKNRQFYFLDETIQHSPSQYIVLAYYDIIHTLLWSR